MSNRLAREHHQRAVLLLVCAAQFMVILDVSVVNVALPSIRGDLGFSSTGLQWVVNAYTLTFGGLLLLGGRAGDLFGRRRMFLIGIAVFALASLLGGVAQSSGTLIAARALQGIGGAIVAPSTLAILATTFSEGRERTRAFAAWGAVSGAGGSAGVLVGGALTQLLDWRWILFVNVPIGAAILWRARRDLLPDAVIERVRSGDLDVAGALTATAGLVALVFGIVRTEAVGWGSPQTLVALAAGAVLLATFVALEARVARRPLVPLRIFGARQLTGANVAMFLLSAAMFSMWFFLSLYFREVLGYSPLLSGLAFLPLTAGLALGSTQAAKVVAQLGARTTLGVGFVLAAGGLFWFSRIGVHSTYLGGLLGPSVLAALGMGLTIVPLTTAAVAGVAPQEAGLASGLINVARQVGGAVGLALLATLAASRTSDVLAGAHGAVSQALTRTALTDGFGRTFELSAGFALLGAVAVVLLLGRGKRPAPVPAVAEPVGAASQSD